MISIPPLHSIAVEQALISQKPVWEKAMNELSSQYTGIAEQLLISQISTQKSVIEEKAFSYSKVMEELLASKSFIWDNIISCSKITEQLLVSQNPLWENALIAPSTYDEIAEKFSGSQQLLWQNAIDAVLSNKYLLDDIRELNQHFSLEETYDDKGEIESELVEKNSSIEKELKTTKNFHHLSSASQVIVIFIAKNFIIPILVAFYVADQTSNEEKLDELLSEARTIKEVLKVAKSPPISVNKQSLKDYRLVKSYQLNVREEPQMKSKIVGLLSLGDKVFVIDSSNRSWLLVSYKVNGKIKEGWVSRRYTVPFR